MEKKQNLPCERPGDGDFDDLFNGMSANKINGKKNVIQNLPHSYHHLFKGMFFVFIAHTGISIIKTSLVRIIEYTRSKNKI